MRFKPDVGSGPTQQLDPTHRPISILVSVSQKTREETMERCGVVKGGEGKLHRKLITRVLKDQQFLSTPPSPSLSL